MKQQLHAGATLDVLTKGELVQGLREWMVSDLQGARPFTFSAQSTITGAGDLVVGGEDSTGRTGPEPGFLWLVRRIALQGVNVGVDPTSIYLDEPLANRLVYPNLTGTAAATGYKSFNSGELVLKGDEKIVVASTAALIATGICTLTGAALAVPMNLAWKYL